MRLAHLGLAVLLGPLSVGCLPSARVPPTTTPSGNSFFFNKGTVLGAGLEMTGIGSYLVENGEKHDRGYGPRKKIPLLQLLSFSARESFRDNCDVGFAVRTGAVGGDVRCGRGDERKTVAVSTGAEFRWWHGLVGRTEVQAGAQKDGFVAFASTGVTYSYFKHTVDLGSGDQLKGLLLGPEEPYVAVRQYELAWSSSITLGLPMTDRGDALTMFLGFTFDQPFTTSSPDISCVGCGPDQHYTDFDPGFRIGGMVGLSGTSD